jgi:CubicO group peptidase (beta-lactamase class C family)
MLKTGLGTLLFWMLVLSNNPHCSASGTEVENGGKSPGAGLYFPAAGNSLENQDRRTPQQVGLDPGFIGRINQYIAENPYAQTKVHPRWALWRHGYIVHVEGDFHKTTDVASLRKTLHAMIVGAAIKQGRIPSHHQKMSQWLPELKGRDAEATWWHVMTQSAGFDYPYGDHPDYEPGRMWTYSDWNLVHLCNALARVYGKKDFYDNYADVAAKAYFDAIGMKDWSTAIRKDGGFGNNPDGVRFVMSLEHMGRLGLLALARGSWNGRELIPRWFVEELETKQTYGMRVNYDGPNDGRIGLSPQTYPECPYGYLTWVNTDRDLFAGADRAWACGRGAGGSIVLWNHKNGIVFAGIGIQASSGTNSIARVIDSSITGSNPLADMRIVARIGQWYRFETSVTNARNYLDPYRDVSLDVTYEFVPRASRPRSAGKMPTTCSIKFWGFYDGGLTWKIRFMPDRIGTWKYSAVFSDGSTGIRGTFDCVPSEIPGMISVDQTNPMWFGYKGGGHVLVRSFHVGDRFFAENWPSSKRKVFLDWMQRQGYNMLSVASHYLNRDTKGRGRGWRTPDLWPLNAAEYQKMEVILDDLAERGIIVYPFAGFFGQSSDFPADHSEQTEYLKYSLARFGSYWNVLFNVAGPEPKLKPEEFQNAMTAADINRLGSEIKKLDVFGHLVSVHNPGGDDPFRDEDWLSFVTLQGWKGTNLSEVHKGLLKNHHKTKPLYAQEVFWPGNKYHDILNDVDIRKKAFVIIMSGAAINYADMDGNSSSGFSGSMDVSDRIQTRHDIVRKVWDFFETIPFYRMSPNQRIVDSGFCLAEEGKYYLVYLAGGGVVNIALRAGSYNMTWINAQDTSDRRYMGITNNGKKFSAPDDGDDWLLFLTAEVKNGAGSLNPK